MVKRWIISFSLFLLISATVNLYAAWDRGGTAVCTEDGLQQVPHIITVGSGSAVIVWHDKRTGNFDIYAQRVDIEGVFAWQDGGIPICTASGHQVLCQVAADGGGGVIIVWRDSRDMFYDIYVQRIDAGGATLWAAGGIAVCTAGDNQNYPKIVADGSGGAIITWFDHRTGENDIYAQRIDAGGNILWAHDGVAVCTALEVQIHPVLAGDSRGGAIIAWMDYRNGDCDIYAQRVNSVGSIKWAQNGEGICTVSGYAFGQRDPRIVPDSAGGAIITWKDYRGDTASIYAQRIDSTGVVRWTNDGIRISTAPSEQDQHQSAPDGYGGVVATWRERFRSFPDSTNFDIYAQRVDTSGTVLWSPEGAPVCTSSDPQDNPTVISDATGGWIIAWSDTSDTGYWDIHAQRIDDSGSRLWAAPGRVISDSTGWVWPFESHIALAPDSLGGVFVAWHDNRVDLSDIYANRVDRSGNIVITHDSQQPFSIKLFYNYPNPFNPITTIIFDLPRAMHAELCVYNVEGECVATIANAYMTAGRKEFIWTAEDAGGRPVASGIYFYRLTAGDVVQTKKMVLIR